MLLGDFNSIYIGDTSIDAVYIGSDLVWSSNPTTMPHLDGVLCYYDCNDGIRTEGGNPEWVNRISGGSNMVLHNASVAQDGAISFYGGNDSGNGRFSCSTTESATMYVLFKRTGLSVIDNYIHICGSVANGEHFPYVGGSGALWKYGIQFMLNNNVYSDTGLFQYDLTGDAIRDGSLSCLDYHVVCCIRQKNGAVYDNLMYVDGTYIGRIDGSSYPPGTNYGVCIGVDSFGYEDKTHDGYDTLIKMIAISNQAHTAQQVAENSAWLLSHFTVWSSNIFDTLTFTGGYLDTNGVVQHQSYENYGTSDFFECGNNTKVRVSFTQRYNNERLVMLCAYDENKTFIGSAIYESTSTLGEKEFIGEIPSGAVYLRYSYLWGKTSFAAGDLNTVIQLGS